MKSTATILSCIALWLYTAGAGAAANVKDPNGAWVIMCKAGQMQVVSDGSCVSACPQGTNLSNGSCVSTFNPPPPRSGATNAATNARSPDTELSKANVKDQNGAWVILCKAGQMQVVSDGSCVSACPQGTNLSNGSCVSTFNPPPPRSGATNAATNVRSPDTELSKAKSELLKCLDKAPNNVVNTNSVGFVAHCLRQLGW